jgi:hypothetical protein
MLRMTSSLADQATHADEFSMIALSNASFWLPPSENEAATNRKALSVCFPIAFCQALSMPRQMMLIFQ